jgi:hypothetical protein
MEARQKARRKEWRYIAVAYAIVTILLLPFALRIAWKAGIEEWGAIFSLGQLPLDSLEML